MSSDVQGALQALAGSLAAASSAAAQLAAAWPGESASSAAGHDLSVGELAERLGRSANAVRDWLRDGLFEGAYRLPGVKRAGAWRIPESAVASFAERQRLKTSRQDRAGRDRGPARGVIARPAQARDGAPDLSAWRSVRASRLTQSPNDGDRSGSV